MRPHQNKKPVNRTPSIVRDLRRGMPVSEVAARNQVSCRYVYEAINRYDLPRNRPIAPRGGLEKRILHALKSRRVPEVARLYSQAQCNIERVIKLSKRRTHA